MGRRRNQVGETSNEQNKGEPDTWDAESVADELKQFRQKRVGNEDDDCCRCAKVSEDECDGHVQQQKKNYFL
jgi:hypothetical protein